MQLGLNPAKLQVLLDRLRNDITRLTAVKAITTVAHSPLPIDLNLVIEPVLTELTSFMRKANRPLKQASLAAMEVGFWSIAHWTQPECCCQAYELTNCPSLDSMVASGISNNAESTGSHCDSICYIAEGCIHMLQDEGAFTVIFVAFKAPSEACGLVEAQHSQLL